MDEKRREFLKLAGLASLGVVLSSTGCREINRGWPTTTYSRKKPPVPGEENWLRGEIIEVSTTCGQCPAGCGIKVRVQKGRVIRVVGNEKNPVNFGGIGPKGHSGPQVIYSKDRIKHPYKRNALGQLVKISWKQALKEVGDKLGKLRKKGSHQLAALCGLQGTVVSDLIERFVSAYGSPNYLPHSFDESDSLRTALQLTTGHQDLPVVDWRKINLVYSFGAALYNSNCQLVHLSQALSELRYDRFMGHRGKLVQFDTQYGRTAAEADAWFPIKPGTYGLLALGMARILMDEKLYNQKYIEKHTSGFDKFATLLKGAEYSADEVAKQCGIRKDRLVFAARKFAKQGPSVAVLDHRAVLNSNGTYTAMAVHALNAMVGAFEDTISFSDPAPLAEWPQVEQDEIIQKGLAQKRVDRAEHCPFAKAHPHQLIEALETEKPYKIEALLLYYSNPIYSLGDSERVARAIKGIPMKVSFASAWDDTARLCDYVLPVDTYLERWDLHKGYPNVGYSVVGLQRPVMVDINAWRDGEDEIPTYRMFDSRNPGTVLIELARSIGGSLGKAFSGQNEDDDYYYFDALKDDEPYPSVQGAIQSRLRGLTTQEGGSIQQEDFDDFWGEFLQKGFWSANPESRKKRLQPVEFSFLSSLLQKRIEEIARASGKKMDDLLKDWKISARGDQVYMPHYEPPVFQGDEKEYPLHLFPYKPMTYTYETGMSLAWLQELKGTRVNENWKSWVEINPATARKMGLREGDKVKIASPRRVSETLAISLYKGMPEDMVAVARGMGHKMDSDYADLGMNIHDYIPWSFEPISGGWSLFSGRVKLIKA